MRDEDRELRARDDVEELLDAYADRRLMPAGPVLARIRANVMAQAAAAAAAQRALAPDQPSWRPGPGWAQLHLPRRAFALGMAATLTVGTGAAVLAAPPGSPFYNARLVIESALLPPASLPDARLAAYEEHLEHRLAEATAAADDGDGSALAAALAAYRAEVERVVAEAGLDAEQLAHIQAMLAKHTAILEQLATRVPEQASIEHAIEASEKAAQRIKEKGKQGNPGVRPSRAPGGQGGQPPDGQGGPQAPNQR